MLPVSGKGSLERFDYWLNQFKYVKAMGELACTLGMYNKTKLHLDTIEASQKKIFAREKLLPVVIREVDELKEIHRYLVSSISTTGEIGNVTNLQQHVIPFQIQPQIKEIVKLTGDSTWVPDLFPKNLEVKKMIVLSPQTIIQKGKDYTVKALIFNLNPQKLTLYWKILGNKDFKQSDLTKTSSNCWLATIPASQITDDFEYYISTDDTKKVFPVTAPLINFAVVRY